ncbi:MAG: hypothetical protein WC910_07290 [Bacteroidales bacterium]|jgi:hypothetical protein
MSNIEEKMKEMMEQKMKERWSRVAEVHNYLNTPAINAVLALVDFYLNSVRLENDTVPKEKIEFNQGKIDAFLDIKEAIEIGVPNVDNFPKIF